MSKKVKAVADKNKAPIARSGLKRISSYLKKNRIDVALIEDSERYPDISLFYLTGIKESASVLIFADGSRSLIPWDVELARRTADVEEIIERPPGANHLEFLSTLLLKRFGRNFTFEVPSGKSYLGVMNLKERLTGAEIICKQNGVSRLIDQLRAQKSASEVKSLKKAASLTDSIVAMMPDFLESAPTASETDIALWIESTARQRGASGISFETIAACPERSWQLHAIPGAGLSRFKQRGIALIDFGLRVDGYCSDVTVPFCFGKLKKEEQRIVDSVQRAYDKVLNIIEPGLPLWRLHVEAVNSIKKDGYRLIHSIGHGLGLLAHDPPFLPASPPKKDSKNIPVLKPGMAITVEPGIYTPEFGGCRLENDVLITKSGFELMTHVKPQIIK